MRGCLAQGPRGWGRGFPSVSVDAEVHTLAIKAAVGAAGSVGLELRETSERTCAGGRSVRTVGVKPGWGLAKGGRMDTDRGGGGRARGPDLWGALANLRHRARGKGGWGRAPQPLRSENRTGEA